MDMCTIFKSRSRILILTGAALVLLVPSIVMAQAAISQSFKSNNSIVPGTIVSLDDAGDNVVKKASQRSAEKIIGIAGEGSLVELSRGSEDKKQVQVVTSGVSAVLVSDVNGLVNPGDKITISPVSGVGMKAIKSGYVVGSSQAPFTEASSVTEQTVFGKNGEKKKIKIGLLPVQVNINYYESIKDKDSILPNFLMDTATMVSGKNVSPIRVIAALVTLLAGIAVIAALLSSSVRSSIISIGRNPLAASAVRQSLVEVSLFTLGVLLIMLVGAYLILAI